MTKKRVDQIPGIKSPRPEGMLIHILSDWDSLGIPGAQIHIGDIVLSVHNHIDFPKDTWVMSTNKEYANYPLDSKTLEEAKREALQRLNGWLEKHLQMTRDVLKR